MKLIEVRGGVVEANDDVFVWDWDNIGAMPEMEKLAEIIELIHAWELPQDLLANIVDEFIDDVLNLVKENES